MKKHEILRLLRTDDEYAERVFREQIEPIRYGLCELLDFKMRPYQRLYSDKIIMETLKAENNELAAIWARQCVDGDTLVFDKNGELHKIRDIGFSTGIKNVYRVKSTRGYEIISTLDHRFFTKNGWLTLEEIKNNNKWNCGQYKLDYRARIGGDMYASIHGSEGSSLSEEEIMFLSYLLADGYFKNPKQSIKFTNINPSYINEFQYCLEKIFGFNGKKRKKGNGWDLFCTDKQFQYSYDQKFEMRNPVRLWLNRFEWKFGFPTEVWRFNSRQLGLFLNRMYSCDGYVSIVESKNKNKNPSVEIGLVDDEIKIKALQMLLLKAGIHSYISPEPNEYLRIRISGKYDIMNFLNLTGLIYGKEPQCRKALEVVKQISHRPVDCMWQSIKSVEYLGEQETFNMEVPVTESYIANGFLVHNSGKTEVKGITVLTLIVYFLNIPWDFNVGWFAPAQSVSIMVARKRVVKQATICKEYLASFNVRLVTGYGRERVGRTGPLLVFRNDKDEVEAQIRSLSANPKSQIKGDTLDLIIIEDTQEVDQSKMDIDIFPMASTGAPIVMDGVPIPDAEAMNAYYIETITKNPRNSFLLTVDWKRACGFTEDELREVGAWDDTVKIYQEEIDAYENESDSYRYYLDQYRRHVLKARERLMNSDPHAFLSQYELRWFTGARKLLTLEQVMELEAKYDPNPDNMRFWSLDTAKMLDSTVGVIYERYLGEHHIIGLFEREGIDYTQQAIDFVAFLKEYKPLRYGFIDATGGGELFIDNFKFFLYKEPKEIRKEIGPWDGFDFRNREEVNRMNQLFCMELLKGNIHFDRENVDKNNLNKMIEQLHTVDRVYHGHYLWLEAPTKSQHDDYPVTMSLARYASEEKSQKVFIKELTI